VVVLSTLCAGELNYRKEAANVLAFMDANAALASFVRAPEPLVRWSTGKVLVLEWMEGDRLRDLTASLRTSSRSTRSPSEASELVASSKYMALSEEERKARALRMVAMGVESSLAQLLGSGVVHADPHPGNLLLAPTGELVYLDFGLLGRVSRKHQRAMLAAVVHLANCEWSLLTRDLASLEALPPYADRMSVTAALAEALGGGPEPLVRPPSAGGGPALAFGPVSNVLWDLALRFRFRLLPSFTLVIRSLSTLEGIALSVDPDFKIFSAAYPYVMRRLLTDNCSETRAVVRDLLLTPSGSLRWQRMLSFAEVAAQASANSANVSSGLAAERRDSKLEMAIELVLSRRGAGVRRVLLEADMTSIAWAVTSPEAASLRTMLVRALATRLQGWLLGFLPWVAMQRWREVRRQRRFERLQEEQQQQLPQPQAPPRASFVFTTSAAAAVAATAAATDSTAELYRRQKAGAVLSREEAGRVNSMLRARRRRLLLLICAAVSRLPPSKLLWFRLLFTGVSTVLAVVYLVLARLCRYIMRLGMRCRRAFSKQASPGLAYGA